jgi:hypothetical protein
MTAHMMKVYSIETSCIQYTASRYSQDPASFVQGNEREAYPQWGIWKAASLAFWMCTMILMLSILIIEAARRRNCWIGSRIQHDEQKDEDFLYTPSTKVVN